MLDPIKADIKEVCKDLGPSETRAMVCPFCQDDWETEGRPSYWRPEKSFSVTREPAGYLYHCYRATCVRGNKGGLIADKPYIKGHTAKKEFKPRFYDGPLVDIPEKVYANMVGRYGIDLGDIKRLGWRWAKNNSRLYVPITDARGYIIGEWLKTSKKEHKPKTLLNRHNDVPMVYCPQLDSPGTRSRLLVVEDPISAVKLSDIWYTCAALGTHISEDMVAQWIREEVKHIVLILDGDAVNKAMKYMKRYNGLINISVQILPDGKDPKDLSYEELEDRLL